LALLQLAALGSLALGGQFMTGGGAAPQNTPPPGCGELSAYSAGGKDLGDCPLEKTTVNAQVDGFGAEVTVVQRFKNNFRNPIEAIYAFPLPNDAAVGRMRIKVGARLVEGLIKKRTEAEAIYKEAKNAGKIAALLNQERPNVFTQHVANILPGAVVEVEITYVQLLKYADGELEYSFPMVVGPRFLGNARDPEKIDPPRASRTGTNISVTVDIHGGGPIRALRSVLHDIDRANLPDGGVRVKLSRDDEIPNKDFILRYSMVNRSKPA
jgi:Ca-activated chloride channel homolog